MIHKADLDRLKKLNEVTRLCSARTNEYSKDLFESLLARMRMLEKQKDFLQKKLREVYNDAKTKKTD